MAAGTTAALITGGISLAEEWLTGKQEKAKAKTEITKAKAEAAISAYKNHQEDAHEWELEALGDRGWKDEWWTVIISIAAVLCFIHIDIPYLATLNGPEVVRDGFDALSATPPWFQTLVELAVYTGFGYRYGGKGAKKMGNKIMKRMEGKKK
mgnify:CR=1 FL=1